VEYIEKLEKKCPRCGKASANSSNPSGRCSKCLKKLKSAKKTPGHWQRAQTKADDALRRQDGKNGTASHKSKGRGSRKSIVNQVERAERKTGQKLSPDRKNNGKGYASSNTRMVPEKLNRGRHKVDSKKLNAWRKRMKKNDISVEELYHALLLKLVDSDRRDELETLMKVDPFEAFN
jgi:Zn-dependent M32 family carboxypeptidase